VLNLFFHCKCLLFLLGILSCTFGSFAHGQEEPTAEQIAEWRDAAEKGDGATQHYLGFCYANGKGVVKDDEEAVRWYRKAAEQGIAAAQLNLGLCYSNAKGVVKDEEEAVRWYRKAAEQGIATAQLNLGSCYSNGKGVVKDEEEAVRWFRKSAEQGDAGAQASLGYSYKNGQGVVKNGVEAVRWYRKAAEQGYAYAQGNLARCYEDGVGVVKNDIEAYKWFILGVANGDERSKKYMPLFEKLLSNEQRVEGQRLAQKWEVIFVNRQAKKEEQIRPDGGVAGKVIRATGTGFFITDDGYLVTSCHVVEGCVKVNIHNGEGIFEAVVVRVDAATDLALLKVSGSFHPLPVVSSRTTKLGAMVATVGFPNIGLQGFEPKLS
jgi:hypothetical protein